MPRRYRVRSSGGKQVRQCGHSDSGLPETSGALERRPLASKRGRRKRFRNLYAVLVLRAWRNTDARVRQHHEDDSKSQYRRRLCRGAEQSQGVWRVRGTATVISMPGLCAACGVLVSCSWRAHARGTRMLLITMAGRDPQRSGGRKRRSLARPIPTDRPARSRGA